MPRTLWKGTLSFGLVTIPVALYPATQRKSPSFRQLRASDHSPVGYNLVAKTDDTEVSRDEIVKGYEYTKGSYVVFSGEELDELKPPSSHTIEIEQFAPRAQIDPWYFDSSYFLAPQTGGEKAYTLLRDAMGEGEAEAVAICRITLRDKEHLAAVRLGDDLLILETMFWPDELRELSLADLDLGALSEPRENELAMARQLVANLTTDFDPDAFSDAYRARVEEAVQKKIAGEEVVSEADEAEPAGVVDLMDALRRSVESVGDTADAGGAGVEGDASKEAS